MFTALASFAVVVIDYGLFTAEP